MLHSFARAAAAAAILLAAAPAPAHEFTAGDLLIDHPMAFAPPPNARTGAAYMTIVNRGAAADRLVSASTPAAGKVEFHTTIRDGDVMRMREVAGVAIAPGATVKFQRGGLHVMLIDLRQPLNPGDTLPLMLVFEKAGAVAVTVDVESPRGAPPSGHGGHAH